MTVMEESVCAGHTDVLQHLLEVHEELPLASLRRMFLLARSWGQRACADVLRPLV